MADLEKIINGLRCCLSMDSPCGGCPYYSYEDIQELNCERNLRHDAIELLKEQVAIIDKYHQADAFLDVHGWKWDGT